MSVNSMIFKLPKYLLKNNGFDDEIFEFLKIKKLFMTTMLNFWKKQLEGITPWRERELEKLERENAKTIEEVYRALVGDHELQAWIERIKGHEWVRVVEGR